MKKLIAAALVVGALIGLAKPAIVGAQTAAPLSWTFSDAAGWTAERGTLSVVDGKVRLQPDKSRRVVLLSPAGLPEAAAGAGEFVVGVPGTGLQRVRIQGRRDARGGWITIADASGSALRESANGYVVRRKPGPRDVPVERLRVELEFRTTNPRTLERLVVNP